MKRATILLLSSVVVFVPRPVKAQTLDELQHPLMAKGNAAAAAEYEYYAVDHLVGDFAGTFTMSFSRPENVLFPQLRVGLAKNLELRLDGTNQFPTLFSDPGFAAWTHGGHALYTTAIRSGGGNIVFRPEANLELRGSYRWGRSQDNLNYSSGSGPVTEMYESQTGTTDVVSVAGTWLSAVGQHNRPLQSNLDGLHHPLLGRRHWVVDGELMRRWYDYGYRSTGDPEFEIAERMRSTDTRLRLGVRHGLTDRVQIHADGYWHPRFRMTNTSQVTSTWMGKTTVTTTESWTRYEGVFGWRLNGTWRVNQQAEMFLEGTREQQGIAQDTASRSGPLETYRTTTIRFGGTWLSRRPTRSAPLLADLAGLYHPFVEPKQVKVDGLVDHFGYRGDVFVPAAWLWRVQATTGVWPWMQATAYGGMITVERSPSAISGSAQIPDRYKSMGAQLTLRLFGRLEAFGSVHLHPAGFFTAYPLFILGRDDPYHYYRDVFTNDLGGDRTLHVGLRFVM